MVLVFVGEDDSLVRMIRKLYMRTASAKSLCSFSIYTVLFIVNTTTTYTHNKLHEMANALTR